KSEGVWPGFNLQFFSATRAAAYRHSECRVLFYGVTKTLISVGVSSCETDILIPLCPCLNVVLSLYRGQYLIRGAVASWCCPIKHEGILGSGGPFFRVADW
ncbi:unnamed protein product, partial [Pylaiella littoralis]